MIRFKITVRMTDNTTEITIEARQPMREALMPDAFHAYRRFMLQLIIRARWGLLIVPHC